MSLDAHLDVRVCLWMRIWIYTRLSLDAHLVRPYVSLDLDTYVILWMGIWIHTWICLSFDAQKVSTCVSLHAHLDVRFLSLDAHLDVCMIFFVGAFGCAYVFLNILMRMYLFF